MVESLRDDFDKSWLVTSTRIIYNPDTLDGKIVHNHGSAIVQPTERRVPVPVYQGTPLGEVLESSQGRDYLHALFNTRDSPENVEKALTALSGKGIGDTYVWTLDQASRASNPEGAAGFVFVLDGFLVFGSYRVDGGLGLSHGVSLKSAKPTRKK